MEWEINTNALYSFVTINAIEGLYDKVIADVKTKLQQACFELVDSADWADYTLSLEH